MKSTQVVFLAVLVACLSAFITAKTLTPKTGGAAAQKETTYERVMRTKTLRCGYIVWPPEFNKDANTGAFSGIAYDVIQEMAKRLGLKIDWVEEVNFSTMAAALKANRFDAICFSLYRDSPRAAFARFTKPLYYSGTGIFVRANDNRFDHVSVADLNNAQYKVATMDGEMSAITARTRFPNATQVTLPNTVSATDTLLNVATSKADFTLTNTLVGTGYMHANPGQLKNIAADKPIQMFSHGYAFQPDAEQLVEMFDIVLEEMQDQGTLDEMLFKYPNQQSAYYRVSQPYKLDTK